MTEVYIKYNPYIVKTKILINGEELVKGNYIHRKCLNQRLQYWIEKSLNWNGILPELKEYVNDDKLNITFHGRKIDFDDLEYMAKKTDYISLKFEKGKDDADILEHISNLTNTIYNGPIEELKTEKIKNIGEEIKNSEFKVSVIATMSSGKSTLINSILGKDLLPSKNEACTARISRIKDNSSMSEFTCLCLDEKKQKISKKAGITTNDLEKYNEDENITFLDIEGPMKEISGEKMNLVLLDTPGPNNSRNDNHRRLTEKIINDKEKNVVLYVINATQFGIDDDDKLLEIISNSMKKGGKQSKDRFIFAVNKCDYFDVEKGETINNLLDNIREYLKKYGIEDPNLYPISAQIAKLIRMNDEGIKLTRTESRELDKYKDFIELEELHLEKFATLSPMAREKLQKKLEKMKAKEDYYGEALIHTGIPAIEEAINEYLDKYAFPIKVKETTDRFNAVIKELDMLNKFEQRINLNSKEKEKILKQIDAAREILDNENDIAEFDEKIENIGVDLEAFEVIKKKNDRLCKREFARISGKFLYNTDGSEKESGEVDLEIGRSELRKLEEKLRKIDDNLATELNLLVKDTIENEGEKIVNDFTIYAEKLHVDININGFEIINMRKIKSLISDENLNINQYEEDENIMGYVPYKKDAVWYNPFSWFGYDYIEEVVGKKKTINIKKFIKVEEVNILDKINENIQEKINEAQKNQKTQKAYYKKKIGKLHLELKNVLEDLNEFIKNKENVDNELKETTSKKIWISDINENINKVLEI